MPGSNHRSTWHVVIAAVIGWAVSAAAFVAVAVCAAILSGRTIAGGERAVVGAAIADAAIVLAATIGLAYWARGASPLARWLPVAAFAVVEVATAAMMLLMTIVMLNR